MELHSIFLKTEQTINANKTYEYHRYGQRKNKKKYVLDDFINMN